MSSNCLVSLFINFILLCLENKDPKIRMTYIYIYISNFESQNHGLFNKYLNKYF